eukprot:m.82893 g.82893  ORF g.82893 m.82893 type:complete len:127 (-) comp19587_c0_seq1:8-388(-)
MSPSRTPCALRQSLDVQMQPPSLHIRPCKTHWICRGASVHRLVSLMGGLGCMPIQAHQLVMEGYKWHFDGGVVTVWSAPNYCYRCGNVAAIFEYNGNMQHNFKFFSAADESERGIPIREPPPDYFL